MKTYLIIFALSFSASTLAQQESILAQQKTAIKRLAERADMSNELLDDYIRKSYGVGIDGLSRNDGKEIIDNFQKGKIAPPEEVLEKPSKSIEPILETGMQKRFHFRDGTVREGKILSLDGDIIQLKTANGTFQVPKSEFLSESAEITNKRGELFKGMVLGETPEDFIIRTTFGDAIIQKRDILSMKRYHGGVLDRRTEERRKFYQGEAQLISVFLDPTAFPLNGNTFYMSGLSIGYGLTDRFMITTKFGSNFSGDLNLHPRLRFFHKKSAEREFAATVGFGLHRAYPTQSIIGKYSHAISVTGNETNTFLNDDSLDISLKDIVNQDKDKALFAQAFLVFSSRRVNPTGRGKIGWSTGIKVSNAFVDRDLYLKKTYIKQISDNQTDTLSLSWSNESKYVVPFRYWLSLEYDLRKDLKFVGSAWVDNGYKTSDLESVIEDYTGDDGSPSFALDSPSGDVSMIDFDFGILYAVNENLRIGIHFQQPFIDVYWEFLEF
jgi:hypothetical protein